MYLKGRMWLKGKMLQSEINIYILKLEFSMKDVSTLGKLHLSEPALWSTLAKRSSLTAVHCHLDPIFYMLLIS